MTCMLAAERGAAQTLPAAASHLVAAPTKRVINCALSLLPSSLQSAMCSVWHSSLLCQQLTSKAGDLAQLGRLLSGPPAPSSDAGLAAGARLALDTLLGCILWHATLLLALSSWLECRTQLGAVHGLLLPGAAALGRSKLVLPLLSDALSERLGGLSHGTALAAEVVCAALMPPHAGQAAARALAPFGATLLLAASADLTALALLHLTFFASQLLFLLGGSARQGAALLRIVTGSSRSALAEGRVQAAQYDGAQVALACLLLVCATEALPTLAVWGAAASCASAVHFAVRRAVAALLHAANGLGAGGGGRSKKSRARLLPLAQCGSVWWWRLQEGDR